MDTILSQGYSRIPVYAPDNHRNFIGMLLVKILITYDPEDCSRVRDFALATLPETAPHTSCLDIINFFQEGKSHMVLVSDEPGSDKGALGVVTLEDVIEELIGEEIVDESDVFIDVHKGLRRATLADQKRYRLGKAGNLIEIDESALPNESEHEGKGDDENGPLLVKAEGNGKASGTTFLMRRKSSNASDLPRQAAKPLAVRSNTSDLRQHLKHLGPSNIASKPKPTKYTSVKIKPGVSTIPENQATNSGAQQRQRSQSEEGRPAAKQDNETTSLLDKHPVEQSDGVAALAQNGYGTSAMTPGRQRGQSESASMTPEQASKLAEEHMTQPPAAKPDNNDSGSPHGSNGYLEVPPKLIVGAQPEADNDEDDTVGDMAAPTRDVSKPKRTSRSGSITETLIDFQGVKKTVLDTCSSSDDGSSAVEGNSKSSSQTDLVGGASESGKKDGPSAESKKPKKKKKGKKKH